MLVDARDIFLEKLATNINLKPYSEMKKALGQYPPAIQAHIVRSRNRVLAKQSTGS